MPATPVSTSVARMLYPVQAVGGGAWYAIGLWGSSPFKRASTVGWSCVQTGSSRLRLALAHAAGGWRFGRRREECYIAVMVRCLCAAVP